MTTALVFPGQGSQAVGMGKALADAFPAAAEVFARVDAALGEKLSKVIFEGPGAELTLTANAQPALMATSLAAMRALESEAGFDVAREHLGGRRKLVGERLAHADRLRALPGKHQGRRHSCPFVKSRGGKTRLALGCQGRADERPGRSARPYRQINPPFLACALGLSAFHHGKSRASRMNALASKAWAALRDADWLNRERAVAYTRILFFFTFALALIWIALAHGGIDRAGKPLGTDFVSFWTASKLALDGRAADVYDVATHWDAQKALFGPDVAYSAFFYPPPYL